MIKQHYNGCGVVEECRFCTKLYKGKRWRQVTEDELKSKEKYKGETEAGEVVVAGRGSLSNQ
jgi:hypothetical protein